MIGSSCNAVQRGDCQIKGEKKDVIYNRRKTIKREGFPWKHGNNFIHRFRIELKLLVFGFERTNDNMFGAAFPGL